MEQADLLPLIFITMDFAICCCPPRQHGAIGDPGELGKLLSTGKWGQVSPGQQGAELGMRAATSTQCPPEHLWVKGL